MIGIFNLLVSLSRCLLAIRKTPAQVYRHGDRFITLLLVITTVTALVFTQTDRLFPRWYPRCSPMRRADWRAELYGPMATGLLFPPVIEVQHHPSIPCGRPLTVLQFIWLHAVCHHVLFVDQLRRACLWVGIVSPIRNLCLTLSGALVRPVVQKSVLFSLFLDYALWSAGIGWMSLSVASHLPSRTALRRQCYAGAAVSLVVFVAAVVALWPEFRLICTEVRLLCGPPNV